MEIFTSAKKRRVQSGLHMPIRPVNTVPVQNK